jgi:hypothetical protein
MRAQAHMGRPGKVKDSLMLVAYKASSTCFDR